MNFNIFNMLKFTSLVYLLEMYEEKEKDRKWREK